MFEHLDDHDGFIPSKTMITTVVRDGRRRRRRTRMAQAGTASVATLALGAGAAVTVFNRKLDSVERIQVASLVEPERSTEPYTILLTGLDGAMSMDDGSITQRSDTIALVRVIPTAQRVMLLQLPRDLLVDVPGHGQARINAAIPTGGVDLLVESIRENFGIEINRFVSVDFDGARRIGDAVGGLSFEFQYPTRDRRSGLSIEAPGCHTLDGQALLALVRSRHLETEVAPGRWVPDRGNDYSRMARQRVVSLAALTSLSRLDATDPAGVSRFIDAVVDNVAVDGFTSRDEMVQMFRDIAGSELIDVGITVEEQVVAGAAVLVPASDAQLEAALGLFLDGEPPAGGDPLAEPGEIPAGSFRAVPQYFSAC